VILQASHTHHTCTHARTYVRTHACTLCGDYSTVPYNCEKQCHQHSFYFITMNIPNINVKMGYCINSHILLLSLDVF